MDLEEPDFCAKCDYDLTGLAERGRCPECGQPFDRATGEGIRDAEPPQIRGERAVRRARTLTLVAAAGLEAVVAAALAWRWPNHARTILSFGGFFAGVILLAAATSFVSEKENLPPR